MLIPDFEVYVEQLDMNAGLVVTHFEEVKPWSGSASTAPSDLDYYGYVEFEFILIDENGNELDVKPTQAQEDLWLQLYTELQGC